MRPLILFLSLLGILALTACGTEEELIPPVFSEVKVNSSADLKLPVNVPNVTITGSIDDFAAKVVANSTATGEQSVVVNPDGSWSFPFGPLTEGANIVTFIASDQRGNLNQMILTVTYDPTPPVVNTVTQSLVGDPAVPQLTITFSEALAVLPTTEPFAIAGSTVSNPLLEPLTKSIVTLTLDAALPNGHYTLITNGVTDLAGNSVAATVPFEIATLIP